MSEVQSDAKKPKTREEYSRNVKKLKIKLMNVQSEIMTLQKKIDSLTNTSNDKMITMKIAKFCKERHFTPEMLFRFADRKGKKSVSKQEFEETLLQLGLKLTKEQLLRVEYLIDEDLSGQISFAEFNSYLDAFGIKKEFTPVEVAANEVLKKIDLGKILTLTKENQEGNNNKKDKKKHANLLNYQEFVKYCHKNFPGLKNKELATIFNRLERNSLINLQDLIDYLNDQQAQKKKLEEKNKKRLKRQQSLKESDSAKLKQKSLKSIIQILLRYRAKGSSIMFYSSEFMRLERILNRKKGELVNLFKEIDKKRKGTFRGSFSYNEMINYFIEKQEKGKDLPYAFQLMGKKLAIFNHSSESIVNQYVSNYPDMTEEELKKFFESQFEVTGREYEIISKLIPRQPNSKIKAQNVANLIMAKDENKKVYIKPNIITTKLIFRNGLHALRCCLQLEEKLIKANQSQWNDYEFGPTETDQYGLDSIDLPMPSDVIAWLRTTQIGMNEFWKQGCSKETLYSCSPICPHQNFARALFGLSSLNEQVIWNLQKIDYSIRDVQENNLNPLFKGLYPSVFHYFAKYGIYVIKLFIAQKWKYVVIDNKIPCNLDNSPFFTSVGSKRYGYMSLIEKAYAKVHGSYKNIFNINNTHRYIVELSNTLPIQTPLTKFMHDNNKNAAWSVMERLKKEGYEKVGSKKEIKPNEKGIIQPLYCVSRIKKDAEKVSNTNIPTDLPFKIEQAVELDDNKCKNKHKSHRLVLVRLFDQPTNEKIWNNNWNRQDEHNKYSSFKSDIVSRVNKPSLLESKQTLLVNFKLFRDIFSLLQIQNIDFINMIILRKELEFEETYRCRYEISSKYDFEFTLVLSQLTPALTPQLAIDLKNSKDELLSQNVCRDEVYVQHFRIEKGQEVKLEIYVQNWKSDQNYNYRLTFYMKHPRYELKQRDRHMLFRFVSPYEEDPKLDFSDFENSEKQYIYRTFYRAAERRGCCGCF